MNRSVALRLQNELSQVAVARDALDALGAEFDIPARALFQLQVALDEVVSNVVKYAWADGAVHDFLVRIAVHPDRVDLEIIDDGQAFDPLAAPAPAARPSRQRPRPGGLGIHLVRSLVDHFAYERVDGQNRTKLSKNYAAGTAGRRSGE